MKEIYYMVILEYDGKRDKDTRKEDSINLQLNKKSVSIKKLVWKYERTISYQFPDNAKIHLFITKCLFM